MSEPIKLPPDLLAVTLVREGVNKHRARDIECWMNEKMAKADEKMAKAVEQNTAALRAECDALRADALKAEFELLEQVRCFREDAAGEQVVFDTIVAERDALRADAERYRWLRDIDTGPAQIWELISDDAQPPYMTLKSGNILDAAIDAAIDAARAALKEAK